MKTLTFFCNQSISCPGGIGRIFPIAKYLVRNGFKVNIIAIHPNFRSLKGRTSYVQDGVSVYYAGQMHVLKDKGQKLYFNKFRLLKIVFSSTLAMIRLGCKLPTDAVYCFKPQAINGLAALVVSLLKRRPLYLDCDDYELASNKLANFLERFVFWVFEDRMPRFSKQITYHSDFIKERLTSLGVPKDKLFFLSNGVDEERFRPLDESQLNNMRRQHGLMGKKVVLYVGSMSIGSGHAVDCLLRAFTQVEGANYNAVLVLVGDGEDIDILRRLSKRLQLKKVLFVGRVPPDQIVGWFQLSDFSVEPIAEASGTNLARNPLKIYESMAVGTPVLTADVGLRRKILDDGRCGFLCPIGTEHLGKALVHILSDENSLREKSAASRRWVAQYYWHNLVRILIPIFSE